MRSVLACWASLDRQADNASRKRQQLDLLFHVLQLSGVGPVSTALVLAISGGYRVVAHWREQDVALNPYSLSIIKAPNSHSLCHRDYNKAIERKGSDNTCRPKSEWSSGRNCWLAVHPERKVKIPIFRLLFSANERGHCYYTTAAIIPPHRCSFE